MIGNRVDKHFYAIVSKDISNLKNSPKDKLIKYYFKGRINKAVEIAERYGIKTILNLLILFHPKNYIRPYFKFLNKKFYLKDKGISIIIIELLVNSRIKLFKLPKKDVYLDFLEAEF